MKGYLAIAAALTISLPCLASPTNYGFTAKNNQDPVFLDKCLAFRDALTANDIPVLVSYVDPALLAKYPKRMAQGMAKRAKKMQKITSKPGYKVEKAYVVKQEDLAHPSPNIAAVTVLASTGPNSTPIRSGCAFKRLDNGTWSYVIR